MEYRQADLDRLHRELVVILQEIIRVCEVLHIDYFIQGGTAIGAYFDKGFVPWDDDIDLGMTRDNYTRFLREAPSVIQKGYFIQSFESEPDTPFYFCKVRKDNTLFIEEPYRNLNIHHGIFVDVFPFDNVPDNPTIEKIHRRCVQFCEGLFKKSLMKEAISEGMKHGPDWLRNCLTTLRFGIIRLFPRRMYYRLLCSVQSLFNKRECGYVSIVKMPRDQISRYSIAHLDDVPFEGVAVKAPSDLITYLKHHYPHLSPTLPKELQVTHAPAVLSFDANNE